MKDYFEHIDDYMDGKLSSENLISFEQELKINASLKEAVKNYPDAKKLSEGLLELDMLDTLNKLENANETALKSAPPSQWKWIVILGLVLAIFAIGLSIGKNLKGEDRKEEILASYIKPLDKDATKSIDTVGMNAFEKGKYYFALNRFEDSEQWLKTYLENPNAESLSLAFYWLGAAHVEQGEIAEAKVAWETSEEKEAKENLKLLAQ